MSYKPSTKELLDNNVQFGHLTSKFNPGMSPYILGSKNKVHLIDLTKTAFLIEYACKQIEDFLASEGGQVLWLGTKKQAQQAVANAGTRTNMPSCIYRWIGGTLTNFEQVKKAITRLLHMRDVVAKPLPHLKKKEIVMLKKEAERLEKNVSGIVNLKGTPALLIVVDAKREATAIKEANRSGVPVISLIDTNSDPTLVTTVIPCNDDSSKSINFIIDKLVEAVEAGTKRFQENEKAKAERRLEDDAAKRKQRTVTAKKTNNESAAENSVEKNVADASKPAEAEKPFDSTIVHMPDKIEE